MNTKSPKSKAPGNFSLFWLNGENNTRMIKLLLHTIKEKKWHLLNALRTPQKIYYHEQECVLLKLIGYSASSQILKNHVGANTNFFAVTMNALQVKLIL